MAIGAVIQPKCHLQTQAIHSPRSTSNCFYALSNDDDNDSEFHIEIENQMEKKNKKRTKNSYTGKIQWFWSVTKSTNDDDTEQYRFSAAQY